MNKPYTYLLYSFSSEYVNCAIISTASGVFLSEEPALLTSLMGGPFLLVTEGGALPEGVTEHSVSVVEGGIGGAGFIGTGFDRGGMERISWLHSILFGFQFTSYSSAIFFKVSFF